MTVKTMSFDWIITIIVAVIGSSWFGNYMSQRLSKNVIVESILALERKIDTYEEKNEMRVARQARSKILRFDDELRINIKHSQEYFDDVIEDITFYENYCSKNPNFKNRKAVSAIEHIMKAYDKCHDDNSFL